MPIVPPRPRLPPLNALRAFEAAARCNSFSKAAAELGVTAGAVTQQIRQLEAALGVSLFTRLPHGVVATPAAQAALPTLSRGFDALATAMSDLRAAHTGRALAMAALPCIAQLWLSPRLHALQQAFPGLLVSVTAMERPPTRQDADWDIALFYREGAVAAPDRGLPADAILPVCAPGLAAGLNDPAVDLARLTLLHDAVWRGDWARWLAHAGIGLAVDAGRGPAFSLYSLALDAALAGAGVLMGRTSLIGRHLDDGRLVAPFGRPLAMPDRLTLLLDPSARAHPRQAAVADWLGASAG